MAKKHKSTKEITRIAKLQFAAGQSRPGPALAGLGINMPEFTRAFNDQTKDLNGQPTPVRITIYSDRTFDFEIKTAPTSFKLKQIAKIKSGAANAKTDIVATITLEQAKEVAAYKMVDMNTNDPKMALKQVAGTAKNMGIKIEGIDDLVQAKKDAEKAKKDLAMAASKQAQLDSDAASAIEYKDQEMEINTIADEKASKKEGEE